MEKAQHDLIKERNHKQEQHKEKKKELEKITNEYEKSVGQLLIHFQKSEKVYHFVCQRELEIDNLSTIMNGFLHKEKQMLENEKTKQLANQLREQLNNEEPCPVCGSMEHPNPAMEPSHVHTKELSENIKSMEEYAKKVMDVKQDTVQCKVRLEQLSLNISKIIPKQVQKIRNHAILEDEGIVQNRTLTKEDWDQIQLMCLLPHT